MGFDLGSRPLVDRVSPDLRIQGMSTGPLGEALLSLSLSRLSLGVAQGTEPCAIRRRKLRKPTGMVENEGGGVDDG